MITRRFQMPAMASATLLLVGCARSPNFNVLGSYFPGWIVAMVAGIVLTVCVRLALRKFNVEQHLPYRPLFYFSVAIALASLLWLFIFE